jgi:predicted Zn-dependent protease
MLISEDQDLEIGRKYAPLFEKELGGRISDDELQAYINSVGQRVARYSHNRNLEYHFTALDHESVNAFALPGGYLFITRGMLEKLQTEAQLASILGHEITHVVARDTANQISKEIGMQLVLMAAAVGTDASGQAIRAADVARQILSLSYSRTDEREADRGGMRYMIRAGYDPNGMVETMKILEEQPGEKPPEFFSTHPSPRNRIEYLNSLIERRYADIPNLTDGGERYAEAVLKRLEEHREENAETAGQKIEKK